MEGKDEVPARVRRCAKRGSEGSDERERERERGVGKREREREEGRERVSEREYNKKR